MPPKSHLKVCSLGLKCWWEYWVWSTSWWLLGCVGEATREGHAFVHVFFCFWNLWPSTSHDQSILQCFVSHVKLGVVKTEKEYETELLLEFFFNLASLYLHLNHTIFTSTLLDSKDLDFGENQTKVYIKMCSHFCTLCLLHKSGHFLEHTKTVAFHITQAKAVLIWAKL